MKKLVMLLIFSLALVGCGKNGNPPTQDEIDETVEVVEDMLQEIDEEYRVRFSCNTIATKSHCVDYIGSHWTRQNAELNCGGQGTFSDKTCPYSSNGGCQAGGGTITETVVWSYDYGGQPIDKENAGYEAMACNANPMATWVTPDQLFLNEGGS